MFLGRGNDVAQWDPGDGSDKIEGGLGTDRLAFNGSAGNEITEAAAVGQRVRFTRNLGNIVLDLNDVETLDNSRARRHRYWPIGRQSRRHRRENRERPSLGHARRRLR